MRRMVVVLVLLAACSSSGSAAPTTAPSTTAQVIPQEAVEVCRDAVKAKLVDPETARFDQPVTNTAGTSWQLRGTVTNVNALGKTLRINYSCLVNPSGSSWVMGDVTVTPG